LSQRNEQAAEEKLCFSNAYAAVTLLADKTFDADRRVIEPLLDA